MALRISHKPQILSGIVAAAGMAVFALAFQPVLSINSPLVSASEETAISASLDGSVAIYQNGANYMGIALDISAANAPNVEAITITVQRASGGDVVKMAKQGALDAVNRPDKPKATAPIVVQAGTYGDNENNSWTIPTNSFWSTKTVPTAIIIDVKYGGGKEIQKTILASEIRTKNATYADIAPADTTAPSVVFKGANKIVYNPTTSTEFNVTATDAEGVTGWYMQFHKTDGTDLRIGSVPCSPQTIGTNASATCKIGVDLEKFLEGQTYYAVAHAKDAAGNIGTAQRKIVIDKIAPEAEFISPSAMYNPETAKFNLTATDQYEVKNWRLEFRTSDGKDLRIDRVPCSPQTTGTSATATCYADNQFDKFTDGETYIAYAIATDAAGNRGVAQHTFVADKTKPTIGVVANGDRNKLIESGTTVGPNMRPELVARDANLYRYEIVNGQGKIVGEKSNLTTNVAYAGISHLANGTYIIRSYDRAGNVSGDFVIIMDRTAPTISGFEFQNIKKDLYNPTKAIARATDEGSVPTNVYINIYKKDDSGAWKQQGGTYEQANPNGRDYAEMLTGSGTTKNDGVYRLEAWAKDAAGNVGAKLVSQEFVVDKTAPAIEVSGFVAENPAEFTVRATDVNGVSTIVASVFGDKAVDSEKVLGESNSSSANNNLSDGVVLAEQSATQESTTKSQWTWLGLAWYWWVLIGVILLGFLWWLIAAARRRKDEE